MVCRRRSSVSTMKNRRVSKGASTRILIKRPSSIVPDSVVQVQEYEQKWEESRKRQQSQSKNDSNDSRSSRSGNNTRHRRRSSLRLRPVHSRNFVKRSLQFLCKIQVRLPALDKRWHRIAKQFDYSGRQFRRVNVQLSLRLLQKRIRERWVLLSWVFAWE